jgi:hypothetical protein
MNLTSKLFPVFWAAAFSIACSSTKNDAADGGSGGPTPPANDAGTSHLDGGIDVTDGASGDAGAPVALALVDCKASPADPKCPKALGSDARLGKGPRLNLGHTLGGFVLGTKLVVALDLADNLDDKSLVASVDLATGDRKVISGKYEDPAQGTVSVGAGPSLYYPYDVKRLADGSLVVASSDPQGTIALLKVDPTSGDRASLWSSDATGTASCGKLAKKVLFSVQRSRGVAIGASGEYYLGFEYMTDAGPLEGVARIDPAKGCDVVTLAGKATGATADDVGSGPALYALTRGLDYGAGGVWLVAFEEYSIFKVDPTTGKRTRVSSSYGATQVGDGDAEIGRNSITLDQAANVVWTAGATNTGSLFLTSVDVTTGNRTDRMAAGTYGPVTGTSGGNPYVWTIPGSSYLAVEQGEAIMVFDPASGNSNVVSF